MLKMRGRPKVGKVWVARNEEQPNDDMWWRYQIIAIFTVRGERFYVGVKDNTDGPSYGEQGCATR